MKIKGYYLDGTTSQHYQAYLEFPQVEQAPLFLYIETQPDHIEKHPLEFSQLDIASRLGSVPREISFDDGQLFVTEDNNKVDQLIEYYGVRKKGDWLHKLESKLPFIIISLVLTIFLVSSFVIYGIPSIAKTIAYQMPAIMSDQFGNGIEILDKTVFEPSELDQTRQQEIQTLVAPYIATHQELNPHLYFRSGMGANALALPNGDIVFTDAFVKLAKNNEQLIAVFFHELGHLKYRHLMRRTLQDSMITLMVIFITGDVDSIDLMTGLPTLILDLSYSRDFEIEADTYALEQLHKAQIPLESFADIMQLLAGIDKEDDEDEFQILNYLSTHPPTKARIQLTHDFIEKYKKQENN